MVLHPDYVIPTPETHPLFELRCVMLGQTQWSRIPSFLTGAGFQVGINSYQSNQGARMLKPHGFFFFN
jgi:hypothetical protein